MDYSFVNNGIQYYSIINNGFYGYVFFDMQQSYGLNISWRFGKLNAFVKKTNRTIKNDDLMTGEKGQGKK